MWMGHSHGGPIVIQGFETIETCKIAASKLHTEINNGAQRNTIEFVGCFELEQVKEFYK